MWMIRQRKKLSRMLKQRSAAPARADAAHIV